MRCSVATATFKFAIFAVFRMGHSILRLAGLTDNEAKIYQVLVKQGQSTASRLGSLSNVHRTNAYDAAERLVQKGLATKTKTSRLTYYSPVSPKVLETQAKKLESELQSELASLNSNFSQVKSSVNSVTYEGRSGMREFVLNILNTLKPGDVWYSLGSPGAGKELIGRVFVDQLHRQRVKKKIKFIITLADGPQARKRARELAALPLTECYLLPSEFHSLFSVHVYADSVAILYYVNPGFAIVVQNAGFAEVYRNYIKVLMKKAKRFF